MSDSTLSELLAEYEDIDKRVNSLNLKLIEERMNRCKIASNIFLDHLASDLNEEDRQACKERLQNLAAMANRDPYNTIGAIRLMAKIGVNPELIREAAEVTRSDSHLTDVTIDSVLDRHGFDSTRFSWMSSALTDLFTSAPSRT